MAGRIRNIVGVILFLPCLAFAQVTEWDTIQEGYYKVVVGEDTLQENFTRYDTALKFAYDQAQAGADSIRIVQPDFRFEYESSLRHPLIFRAEYTHYQDSVDSHFIDSDVIAFADSLEVKFEGCGQTTYDEWAFEGCSEVVYLTVTAIDYYPAGTRREIDRQTIDLALFNHIWRQENMATDTDAQAYIDEVESISGATYSSAYDTAIDNLVQDLKAAGIWSKLDRMFLFWNEIEEGATVDLKDPTGSAKAVPGGGITWVADQGYTGDGASLVDLNFNPSTDAVNYTQNSASWAIKISDASDGNHGIGGTLIRRVTGGTNGKINNGSENSITDTIGFFHVDRAASDTSQFYFNGAQGDTDPSTSSGLENNSMAVLGENRFGGREFSTNTVEFAVLGASLGTEAADLDQAIDDYLTATQAGGGETMTMDNGTFSLAGYPLMQNLSTPLDDGTFSLTGYEVFQNLSVPLGNGTFSTTGYPLLQNLLTPLGNGTFSLSGHPLFQNLFTPLENGTFTLTGYGLTFGLSIPVENGTFLQTGYDLLFNRSVPIDKGDFSLSGHTLNLNLSVPLNKGTFSLAGYDLLLDEGDTIIMGKGTFNVDGKDLSFQFTHPIDKGSFSLTGHAVNFNTSIPLERASFNLDGQSLSFKQVIALNQGSFALTGYDLILDAVENIIILSGGSLITDITGLSAMKDIEGKSLIEDIEGESSL